MLRNEKVILWQRLRGGLMFNFLGFLGELVLWGFWVDVVFIILSLVQTASRYSAQIKYIQCYSFHPAIKKKLRSKYPELTEAELERVFLGLRDYFYICNKARSKMVSMPSQVVDDAWHEFILFTNKYEEFCQKAFGRFLHHTPAEAMIKHNQVQDGIKLAWRLACEMEQISPNKPLALPRLFGIDGQLAISGGFAYSLNCIPGDNHYCASKIGCNSCGSGGCGGGCGGCGGGC